MKTKMTIKERRAKLEAEAKKIEIAEAMQEKCNELVEELREQVASLFSSYEIIGYEEEQATEDGELLWRVPHKWRAIKESLLTEEDRANGIEPYHRGIWGDKKLTYEELNCTTQNKVDAYNEIIRILEEADY